MTLLPLAAPFSPLLPQPNASHLLSNERSGLVASPSLLPSIPRLLLVVLLLLTEFVFCLSLAITILACTRSWGSNDAARFWREVEAFAVAMFVVGLYAAWPATLALLVPQPR